MNAIQEMKEAELLYLAEVMNDMAEHIRETTTERWIADEIDEYAKTIREAVNTSDGCLAAEKTLDIRRLEIIRRFVFKEQYQAENPDKMEDIWKSDVVRNLMYVVKDLIEVKIKQDEYGGEIISASLYVGVPPEKKKYIDKLNNE